MSDHDYCDELGYPISSAEALALHRAKVIDLLRDLRKNPDLLVAEKRLKEIAQEAEREIEELRK